MNSRKIQLAFLLSLIFAVSHTSIAKEAEAIGIENLRHGLETLRYPVLSQEPSEASQETNRAIRAEARRLHSDALAFLKTFPESMHSPFGKKVVVHSLAVALLAGDGSASNLLKTAVSEFKTDPRLSDLERMDVLWTALKAFHPDRSSDQHEKGIWQLIREFPNHEEPLMIAMSVAQARGEAGRALAEEILKNDKAPVETKGRARGFLKRITLLGQPLDLSFTAMDGRIVDVAELKGKVVLVDFWATWCAPCIATTPKLKALYEKLHTRGFEIIGISFDEDQKELATYIGKMDLPWPQYFDGKGWGNIIGKEYGIGFIPTMWLIDRTGKVVDINAQREFEKKVTSLVLGDQIDAEKRDRD